jgi:hypothetical protein
MIDTTDGRSGAAGINEQAPVVGRDEIEIGAAREDVWAVLVGLERWPSWNADVKSMAIDAPVGEGAVFRWKAGPGTITSTILRFEPHSLIGWAGDTFGIKAIHFWYLEDRKDGTFVRTEESYDGVVASLFRRPLRKTLDRALADGTRYLKAEAERRAPGANGRR